MAIALAVMAGALYVPRAYAHSPAPAFTGRQWFLGLVGDVGPVAATYPDLPLIHRQWSPRQAEQLTHLADIVDRTDPTLLPNLARAIDQGNRVAIDRLFNESAAILEHGYPITMVRTGSAVGTSVYLVLSSSTSDADAAYYNTASATSTDTSTYAYTYTYVAVDTSAAALLQVAVAGEIAGVLIGIAVLVVFFLVASPSTQTSQLAKERWIDRVARIGTGEASG